MKKKNLFFMYCFILNFFLSFSSYGYDSNKNEDSSKKPSDVRNLRSDFLEEEDFFLCKESRQDKEENTVKLCRSFYGNENYIRKFSKETGDLIWERVYAQGCSEGEVIFNSVNDIFLSVDCYKQGAMLWSELHIFSSSNGKLLNDQRYQTDIFDFEREVEGVMFYREGECIYEYNPKTRVYDEVCHYTHIKFSPPNYAEEVIED